MDLIHSACAPHKMKIVVMDDDDFTIEEVVAVARYHATVEFAPEFIEQVNKSRAIIDRFVEEDRPVYGVTTGFGDNVTKRVTQEDTALLQLNIAHVETPAIDTVVNLAYILLDKQLDEGRTLNNLGLSQDMTVDEVIRMCQG